MDCTAPEKLAEAAEAVVEVMNMGALSGLPLIVFCNKCDRRGDEHETLSRQEVEAALNRKGGKWGAAANRIRDVEPRGARRQRRGPTSCADAR